MKQIKNESGITLIALVVTIIILLILAGVSITTLSSGGLFGRAESSAAKYEQASRAENSTITSLMDKYDRYEESTSSKYKVVLENNDGWEYYYLADDQNNIMDITDAYVVSSKGTVNIFDEFTVCQNIDRDELENQPGDRFIISAGYLISDVDAVMFDQTNTLVLVKDGKEYTKDFYVSEPNIQLEARYSVNNSCYFLELPEWRDGYLYNEYRYNKIYVVIDGTRVDISNQIRYDDEMGYALCVKYGEVTVNGQPLEGTYQFIAIRSGKEYSTTYNIYNSSNLAAK